MRAQLDELDELVNYFFIFREASENMLQLAKRRATRKAVLTLISVKRVSNLKKSA